MPRPPALPPLQLSLQFADPSLRSALPRHHVGRWVRAALQRPAQIAVRFVDDDAARALNLQWRGQDHATNVLTFDYEHAPVVVADIVLASGVLCREAAAARLPLQAHAAHLLVHGTLHAQGWDHLDDEQARAMETRESEIMVRLGLPDPYRRRTRR